MTTSLFAVEIPLPPEGVIAAAILIGLAFLAQLAANGVAIWSGLRRQPSADATFATKESLKEMDERLMTEIRTIQEDRKQSVKDLHKKFDDNFSALNRTLSVGMQDVNHAIGRLEGQGDTRRELIEAIKDSKRHG